MVGDDQSVMSRPRGEEQHVRGARVVTQLQPDATLERLGIMDVRLCLGEHWSVGTDHHAVPRATVSLDRQGDLSNEAKRLTEAPFEPLQEREIRGVANWAPDREQPDGRDVAQRPRGAADLREIRGVQLRALDATELRRGHARCTRDRREAEPDRQAGLA